MARKYNLHDGKVGSALAVRLTPKASRDAVVGILEDGTVKVHVTASPSGGKDNDALIALLSDVLGMPAKNVEIVAGADGRDKLLSILGMDAVTLTTLLREYLR